MMFALASTAIELYRDLTAPLGAMTWTRQWSPYLTVLRGIPQFRISVIADMCNIMGIEKEAAPHTETVILPMRSTLIHDLNIPFLAIPMRKLQQSFDERVISDVW